MPVAIILFTFRILLSFQYLIVISLLPKGWILRRIINRTFMFFMGIFISCHGWNQQKKEAKVIVSNHVTLFDALSIDTISPVKMEDTSTLPEILSMIFKMTLSNNEAQTGSDFPLLYFPEEETTNGNVGLLKFNLEIFKNMDGLIQPLVLTVDRARFVPVNVNCFESTFISDLFWALYSPYTLYNICFLPVREVPKENEQLDEFVKSLQKDMAFVLEQEASNVTAKDKHDLIKRHRIEERRKEEARLASSTFNRSVNQPLSQSISSSADKRKSQLEAIRMIEQIKNVLPQVPVSTIQNELKQVNDVDVVISHLLDGTINYIALSEEEQEKEKKMLDEKRKMLTTKPKTNSSKMNWKDRQITFQEKKKLMIEEARRKYLQLHPEYA